MQGRSEPQCRDGSLYVGMASDVAARVEKHNRGFGPEFTRQRRPVELIWSEEFADSSAARKREVELEGLEPEKEVGIDRQA